MHSMEEQYLQVLCWLLLPGCPGPRPCSVCREGQPGAVAGWATASTMMLSRCAANAASCCAGFAAGP
jgi:hypothetical protein